MVMRVLGVSVYRRLDAVVAATVAAALIVLLAHAAPLTYDEAYNRLRYGNLGISGIVRTYDLPNNHVPFTFLQSLIPARLLTWDPWAIRIIGVAVGIITIGMLIVISTARQMSPLLGLFMVAGAPILVSYLFLARGYTFSALLIVCAAVVPVVTARKDRRATGACLGAAALALATWALPTNILIAPGWLLGLLTLWGVSAALGGATVYVAAIGVTFAPIIGQVYAQSKIPWSGHPRWWPWIGDVVASTSLVPVCLGLVAAVAAFAFARECRRRSLTSLRQIDSSGELTLLAAAMSISWFALVALSHAFGFELPLVRSAIPALWVGLVGVVAAFPKGRIGYLGVALLVPGLVWGALMWTRAVVDGDWQRVAHLSRNDVLYGTTPATIRDLPSIGADHITCSQWDTWVCRLVSPNLALVGVTVTTVDSLAYDPNLRCALGSRRPPPPWQVSVYRQGKLLGVLCH
jgi:hypothetical protein